VQPFLHSGDARGERMNKDFPQPPTENGACRVCGSATLRLTRKGNLPPDLGAAHFRITDKAYGRTADIYQCDGCGFRQSSTLHDVIRFYEGMDDDEYEATRAARLLQAQRLLQRVATYRPSGRLLDIGAGSGILVEQALSSGYEAEGIEPSRPLYEQALARGLPVHHGVLPSASVQARYDIATLIDVIEHVEDPVGLLMQASDVLAADGIAVVVTPDVSSLAARVLDGRWWHYRIAHIGYFNQETLARALTRAGLAVVNVSRPAWYFPASYLAERAMTFVPAALRFRAPAFLDRITVRLNLFDSLMVVARKVSKSTQTSTRI
jgi:2-polyprenyl-3-methyl-5-hydroxy-6-metoxy-1,4-benzoquinol methylase